MNEIPFIANTAQLIIATLLGFSILLLLIIKAKIHPLLAIIASAVFIGIGSGMPFELITKAVSDGMTNTLKSIALIVGLGAMFGGLLEVSGAAESIADKLVSLFGENKAGFALGIAGILIGIPVFYDPAFIILMPLIYSIAAKTKKSMLYYVLPMTLGLGIGSSIPPTPAPMLIAGQLDISLGAVTLIALVYGIPKYLVNYLLVKPFASHIDVPVPEELIISKENKKVPEFGKVIMITLLPLLLILINAVAAMVPSQNSLTKFCIFIGQPYLALTISCFAGLYFLGIRNAISLEKLQEVMSKALAPVAMIILVTAGGGVLRYILDYSGMGRLIGNSMQTAHLPVMLIAFLIALLMRIAVGSTTVALTMTLGILASFPQMAGYTPLYIACIGMAAMTGATSFSHVNDSGFWLTKEYLHIDIKTAFMSWTLFAGIGSLISFPLLWIISLFVR